LDYKIVSWALAFDNGGWNYAPANTAIIGYFQSDTKMLFSIEDILVA